MSAAFVFLSFSLYPQGKEGPPPPQQKAQSANAEGPCGRPDNPGSGNGSPPPPPPGLCLPINDYLIPLFILGILLGAVAVSRFGREFQLENN